MAETNNGRWDVLKRQPQGSGSPSNSFTEGSNRPDAKDRVPVMTLTQAADYLQISRAHLSNLINGKVSGVRPLRCVRLGRRVLIKREWIDEWLETKNLGAVQSC